MSEKVNRHYHDSKLKTAEIFREMADTYKDRNIKYGDCMFMVGKLMVVMFPNGITLQTEEDFNKFHQFEWMIGKLTRFVNSGRTHIDSIHDLAVYAAMQEAMLCYYDQNRRATKETSYNINPPL